MINVSNISIHFAGRYLFNNVTFAINSDDRIGLIGRNGTGKSTLLRIITKQESPEEGIITMPNDYKTGFLPQELKITSDRTIIDEAFTALEELKKLEQTIKHLSDEISGREDYDSPEYNRILQSLTDSNERLSYIGSATAEADVEKILRGLGFKRSDMNRLVSEFSGGWQMRVELAKILIARPDCILLDEPTNHLDIESIRWLEMFLRNYSGSVIIVSHDSRFLESVCQRTIEISNGKIFDMRLPLSQFLEQRQVQRQQQLSAYKNQQKKIEETERFIERFRYKNTLATRVQSRIKQLEKTERIEVEEEDNSTIRLQFAEPPRTVRIVAEAESLSKSYGDLLVLDNIDFVIERKEKVAFVGKNGEGKTTFSKIIAGDEDYDGKLKKGSNVVLGYYAQHQAELLDGNATVFDIIDSTATGEMRSQIRNLLGAFLFSGEDVYKKVKVLSGGEKSRLAIARLLLQPFNLLILDEPTNHLDMVAKNVLKQALLDYKGTLILVSHDRDFLQGLTTRTIEFRNKKIKEYEGDIEEFLRQNEVESFDMFEKPGVKKTEIKKPQKKITDSQKLREQKKDLQRKKGRLKKQIEKIEAIIEETEEKISYLETDFTDPEIFQDKELMAEKKKEFEHLQKLLEKKLHEWEELSRKLELMEDE